MVLMKPMHSMTCVENPGLRVLDLSYVQCTVLPRVWREIEAGDGVFGVWVYLVTWSQCIRCNTWGW